MAAVEASRPPEPGPFFAVSDQEVEAVLEEAGGDSQEAIRMVRRDLAVMAADAASSRGFLRGRFSEGRRRPRVVDEA